MTFVEFGRKIGISASSLQRIETGQQNVTIDTLERLVTRLKCGTDEIFSGE
jgi:transcriptional regulator with XRE-family HTH domain